MTGGWAVGRLPWVAIGAGLVLAGCGSAAVPAVQLSHSASRGQPRHGSAPNAGVQPNGALRCTGVYCVPRTVPAPASPNGSAPKAPAVQPNGAQRCTEVYCVPQAVPAPASPNGSAPRAPAVRPNGAERCTEVYCVPPTVPRGRATFAAMGWPGHNAGAREDRDDVLAGATSSHQGQGLGDDLRAGSTRRGALWRQPGALLSERTQAVASPLCPLVAPVGV